MYIKVSKSRDKTAIRSMDDLSRRTQRIFDKEKSNITKRFCGQQNQHQKEWLRSPAFANNGVLDLTKFKARGGVRGQEEQEHNDTTQ